MWEVHYSQEAANYLEDNAQLVADLFFRIEALAGAMGMPPDGEVQVIGQLLFWHVHHHLVVLRRLEAAQVVRVLVLKPI